MRFSLHGDGTETTEDDILNDVEKLGFDSPSSFDFGENNEFDFDWLSKSMKPIYVDDIPIDLQFPTEQKRYSEFIGKRQNLIKRVPETPENIAAFKRWSEFVGKRNEKQRIYNEDKDFAKRYMEFLGKRAASGTQRMARKRYSEFLG